MDDSIEQGHQLRALAMRVAALEGNVAFLEEWCEEQQDALDRAVGPASYNYDLESESTAPPRALLRIVDLRDAIEPAEDDDEDCDAETIVALVETEHDRRVRQLRRQLNRLRTRLAETLAPSGEDGDEDDEAEATGLRRPAIRPRRISAKQAGRTAP
jgi:hypothetical protein